MEEIAEFHRAVRAMDQDNPSVIHNLLTGDKELSNLFRSPQELESMMNKTMYMETINKCNDSEMCPESIDIFNRNMLPGRSPVLDHLVFSFKTQSEIHAGGSYEKFLCKTVKMLSNHRQVSAKTFPMVSTITYSETSVSDVNQFIASFNKSLRENEIYDSSLPCSLYSLDIEYLKPESSVMLKTTNNKGALEIKKLNLKKLPARICLTLLDKRWDILVPWKTKPGINTLSVRKPLHDIWHKLFSKLQGTAVGIDLHFKISELAEFISSCYTFTNCKGVISIKHYDLNTLLAIAGFPWIPLDLSCLTYFFTGGLHQTQSEVQNGSNRWAELHIPGYLNLYLQSKGQAVINIALISYLIILTNWFPTPGISAIVSRKEVDKFLIWFSSFITAILKSSSLPECAEHDTLYSAHQPFALVEYIVFNEGSLLSGSDIKSMIPPWRNISMGGCLTDKQAFDHIFFNVHNILRSTNLPFHLRWTNNPDSYGNPFVCTDIPVKYSVPEEYYRLLGVNRHDYVIITCHIKDLENQGSELRCKFSPAIQLLKTQLPSLKLLSNNELMLLYTWRYTSHVIKLYYRSVHDTTEKAFQYFHPKELEFIKPILSANVGNILSVPDILVELKKQQKQARATYRYSELLDHKASNKRKFSPSALHKICKDQNATHEEMLTRVSHLQAEKKQKLQTVEADLLAKPIDVSENEEELIVHVPEHITAEQLMQSNCF